ncbi:MAG: hypothetical protein IJO60_10010 [Agathobacter sp.]|nr:hypothetical protein [Agathobacter sp.]
MEHRLKEELNMYFDAPKPMRKRTFLRQFRNRKMSLFSLVFMQIKYISKWVWLVSVLFCFIVYIALDVLGMKSMSLLLTWIPFLTVLSITESMRSYRYGMDELETSARFSLKSIVMARMLILGIGNLLTLMVMLQMLHGRVGLHAVHIFTPYFITASGCLYIVRMFRGNESIFFCFTLAIVICVVQILLPWQFKDCYLPDNLSIWAVLCAIGVCVTIKECYRTIRMTEELVWN